METAELPGELRDYLVIQTKDVYFDEEVSSFTNYNHDGCLASLVNGEIQYTVM